MSLNAAKTVRELAMEFPNATGVFERLGIDYCCEGNRSLEEASSAGHLSADELLDALELVELEARRNQKNRNWQEEPLTHLIDHINKTHHKHTREEISRLGPLFEKVCSVHGKNHPELLRVHATFRG
jgi:regulator of cell morphogenesis and NO signaling